MPFGYGAVITEQALVKEYDKYALSVLISHFRREPKVARKERQKYFVLVITPSKEEYIKLRDQKYAISVESLVDDAFSDIESLGQELRDAYDNMPEGLQQGDVGQRRDEAASALEDIACNKPDVPDLMGFLGDVVHYPDLKATSRRERADEAASMLESVVNELNKWIEELKIKHAETGGDREPYTDAEFDTSDLESFVSELEDQISTIREVDFPGMYG